MKSAEQKENEILKTMSQMIDSDIVKGILKWSKYNGNKRILGDNDIILDDKGILFRDSEPYDVSILDNPPSGNTFILMSKHYEDDEDIYKFPEIQVFPIVDIDIYYDVFKNYFQKGKSIDCRMFYNDISGYHFNHLRNSDRISKFISLYYAIEWVETKIKFDFKFTNKIYQPLYNVK